MHMSSLTLPVPDVLASGSTPLERHLHGLEQIAKAGGPAVPETALAFTAWIAELDAMIGARLIDRDEWLQSWRSFMTNHLPQTVGAMALLKPHGYAGDFEVIDAIYHSRVAGEAAQRPWDEFFHQQAAPVAVRNRKSYFQRTTSSAWKSVTARGDQRLRVLNIASGPGRDMHEWLTANPAALVQFDCVELDAKAIAFASDLCANHASRIRFHRANALRFRPQDLYHLCWSSGLFDYLSDGLFVRVLRTLLKHTLPGGEVVIGNFGSYNPSRAYMELLGDWKLIHRGPEHLRQLALEAGARPEEITVGREPACVNLFLHLLKSGSAE